VPIDELPKFSPLSFRGLKHSGIQELRVLKFPNP